jgi:hypothetical protein
LADVAHDAEVIADDGTSNDDERHPEQEIDQKALPLGFTPADRRRQEQPGTDPRQADPDNWCLDMHVAQEVKRQEAIDLDSVEAGAVRVVMGHDRTDEDLQQKHRRDDEKILADLALAEGQGPERHEHRVHRGGIVIVQIPFVDEQHRAEGEERETKS